MKLNLENGIIIIAILFIFFDNVNRLPEQTGSYDFFSQHPYFQEKQIKVYDLISLFRYSIG